MRPVLHLLQELSTVDMSAQWPRACLSPTESQYLAHKHGYERGKRCIYSFLEEKLPNTQTLAVAHGASLNDNEVETFCVGVLLSVGNLRNSSGHQSCARPGRATHTHTHTHMQSKGHNPPRGSSPRKSASEKQGFLRRFCGALQGSAGVTVFGTGQMGSDANGIGRISQI